MTCRNSRSVGFLHGEKRILTVRTLSILALLVITVILAACAPESREDAYYRGTHDMCILFVTTAFNKTIEDSTIECYYAVDKARSEDWYHLRWYEQLDKPVEQNQ